MRVDNHRLDLLLARQCKSLSDLRVEGLSPQTLTRIRRGEDVLPATLGRLAHALNVDPSELITMEGE